MGSDNVKSDEQFMIGIDSKERQRRENFRRAEAFLYWKFGSHIAEIDRYLFGPHRESLAVLLVEFVEKVEDDLLRLNRSITEQHLQWMQVDIATNPNPLCISKEDLLGRKPESPK